MRNPHNTESNAADIAIVGLGPGGLSSALQAAVDGRTVVAFTDRSQYIRRQTLILSKKAEQLESKTMPDSKAVLKLQEAKTNLISEGDPTQIYATLNQIQPIAEQHINMGLLYQAFRFLKNSIPSCFFSKTG